MKNNEYFDNYCPDSPLHCEYCYKCEFFIRCVDDAICSDQMHIQYLKELKARGTERPDRNSK